MCRRRWDGMGKYVHPSLRSNRSGDLSPTGAVIRGVLSAQRKHVENYFQGGGTKKSSAA
ncbi:MAG: hypothetical protein ACYTEL_10765 [Planctomycetota bacterium]